MKAKIKFINFLMKELNLSVKEMKHFLDVKSKTIYNYRQMDFNTLPEKVKKRFFHLFRLDDSNEIQENLSKMNKTELAELRDRLVIRASLRYKLMETGFNENLKREYLENNGITVQDNIKRTKEYWSNLKGNESIKDNGNVNVTIHSENISGLYLQVLQTELNKKIKFDDYDFIAYLKRYTRSD